MNMAATAPPPYEEKTTPYPNQNAPPTGYPTQQQPLFVGTPMVYLSEYPVQCVCPRCGAHIVTRAEKTTGLFTWLLCGGLVVFGCVLGCCLIPFCIDSAKDTVHYCPNCSYVLGAKRMI
ncbi:unnamed protein product [Rotaria sordida]|uniref:LITAF domain-containing protein n=1 Tax=Rotaria sordida TaxID=392033 RepID=A0A815CPT3_9BILA|nr:unnamed protein product [Rotaria sordida]